MTDADQENLSRFDCFHRRARWHSGACRTTNGLFCCFQSETHADCHERADLGRSHGQSVTKYWLDPPIEVLSGPDCLGGRFIELRAISRDILWETGDLRRATKLSGRSLGLADAIHIATAIKTGCDYVLSSDQRLPLPMPLQRLDPRTLKLEQIEQLLDA